MSYTRMKFHKYAQRAMLLLRCANCGSRVVSASYHDVRACPGEIVREPASMHDHVSVTTRFDRDRKQCDLDVYVCT